MDRIDAMRAFVAVAAEGGFTRAAGRLAIPVQTVSKSVRRLEETLGAQLLDRTTRSVTLTETGRALLSQCEDMVDRYDDLVAAVGTEQGSPRGTIRITAPTAFGARHLTPALGAFLKQHPRVVVDLSLSDRRVSLVEEGFDLAVRDRRAGGFLDDRAEAGADAPCCLRLAGLPRRARQAWRACGPARSYLHHRLEFPAREELAVPD